jgi:hypothetical protein
MTNTQFVVSSPVHGDFAGFADPAVAAAVAHRLNNGLYDALVWLPLIEVDFVVSMEQEAALNRQYQAEEFEVVRLIEG